MRDDVWNVYRISPGTWEVVFPIHPSVTFHAGSWREAFDYAANDSRDEI